MFAVDLKAEHRRVATGVHDRAVDGVQYLGEVGLVVDLELSLK